MARSPAADMPAFAALAVLLGVSGVAIVVLTDRPLSGVALVVAAAGIGSLPFVSKRRAARIAAMADGGLPARARVLTVEPLRQRGAGPRRMRVGYEITPLGRPPYRLSTRHVVPSEMAGVFTPGAVLDVRIDPANPKNVVLVGDPSAGRGA